MDNKDKAQIELTKGASPRGVFRHYKGGFYIAYSVTVDEQILEPLVHYYSMEKETRWTRTLGNFVGEVFLDGRTVKRFTYLRPASPNELLEAYGNPEILEVLQAMAKTQRFLDSIRL